MKWSFWPFIFIFLMVSSSSMLFADREYVFDYAKVKNMDSIKYGEMLKVKITGVNTLDYEYKIKIEAQQPKPEPSTPLSGGSISFPVLPAQVNQLYISVKATGEKIKAEELKNKIIGKFNEILRKRILCFSDKSIEEWLEGMSSVSLLSIINENDLGKLEGQGSGELNNFIDKIKEVIRHQTQKIEFKKEIDKASLLKAMMDTNRGGSILILIEPQCNFSRLEINAQDPSKIEIKKKELRKEDVAALPDDVKKHLEPRVIELKIEDLPAGVVFSLGPYAAYFFKNHVRSIFEKSANPNYEKGSADESKMYHSYIRETEGSSGAYGVAAYWNAQLCKIGCKCVDIPVGVCWGVAYNLQSELDQGISGLMGLYANPNSGAAVIQVGAAFSLATMLDEVFLADEDGNRRGLYENEEIPTVKKLVLGVFVSFSFRVSK